MANRHTAPDTRELRARWSAAMANGPMLLNATAILGAIDVVFGECDR